MKSAFVIGTNLLALYPLGTCALHDLVIPYRISCDLFCCSETGTALSKVSNVLPVVESFIMETTDGMVIFSAPPLLFLQ